MNIFLRLALFLRRQLCRSCFIWIVQVTMQMYSLFLEFTTTKQKCGRTQYTSIQVYAVGRNVGIRVKFYTFIFNVK